jgi:hypothetical protein
MMQKSYFASFCLIHIFELHYSDMNSTIKDYKVMRGNQMISLLALTFPVSLAQKYPVLQVGQISDVHFRYL